MGTLVAVAAAGTLLRSFRSVQTFINGIVGAVGMTRGQVTRVVVLESVLLGAAGGLLGTVGGMCTALLIQLSSQPLLGHPIRASFRPTVVAVNLVAAVAVTALAAWIPARRAARLDLLEAISAE